MEREFKRNRETIYIAFVGLKIMTYVSCRHRPPLGDHGGTAHASVRRATAIVESHDEGREACSLPINDAIGQLGRIFVVFGIVVEYAMTCVYLLVRHFAKNVEMAFAGSGMVAIGILLCRRRGHVIVTQWND
jgi:hypothetical protein